MSDATKKLCALLRSANAHVTFDPGRNHTHPCTFCATPAAPTHELKTIGMYPNGDELTRPVCARCLPLCDTGSATAGKVER